MVTNNKIGTARQPCHYIQLPKNPRFTGRTAILDTLEEIFFAQDHSRKAALVGLGGVGKTQLALHFVYLVKEKRPEYSIFWVPILSDKSVEQAYIEIAKRLGIQKTSDDEDIKELVCRDLSSEEAGKWLLVVDNADDQELIFGSAEKPGIEEYLPESEHGLILLTTRSRQIAVDFAQTDIIDIEKMELEEAAQFLNKSLIQKPVGPDETLITELLSHLTYLPLAIAQAAAYLNQTKMPIHKYLDLLRGAEKDTVRVLGREFRDSTRYRNSQNAVATTWLVSFDQMQKSCQAAVDLMSFLACIEPRAIPQTILPSPGSEDVEWAIGTLCGYSFLVRRGSSDTFDMHSLVHMAMRGWIDKQGRREQVENDAIGRLATIFTSITLADRELWRQYLPHALRVLSQSNECKAEGRYDLLMKVGRCLDRDRRFEEAIRCLEEVYQWRRDRVPEDDGHRLASERALASAYLDARRITEAIEMLEHVVMLQKDTLHEEDESRLTSEHELARAYITNRQIKEAIEILEHVVTVQKDTLDEKDDFRLISEHELARAYLTNMQTKEAIEILEHVVAVEKDTLDETDDSRLISEHELARAYLTNMQTKEAIAILEHVVTVQKDTLDEKDDSRLISEHELARAYLTNMQTKEAIEILEHVVAVEKDTLDETDDSRLISAHELARAYLASGRVKEAIDILEYVVAMRKETQDETDHDRLNSEHELARAYLDSGRIKEAIDILEYVVAMRKETQDETDHDRLHSENVLARAYIEDRQVPRAVELLEHVVAVEARLFVEDNPDRQVSVRLLAHAYEQL
jgi:tetratricopeptide (TPR) repeat protein